METLKRIGRCLLVAAGILIALGEWLIEILEEMGSPQRRRPRR